MLIPLTVPEVLRLLTPCPGRKPSWQPSAAMMPVVTEQSGQSLGVPLLMAAILASFSSAAVVLRAPVLATAFMNPTNRPSVVQWSVHFFRRKLRLITHGCGANCSPTWHSTSGRVWLTVRFNSGVRRGCAHGRDEHYFFRDSTQTPERKNVIVYAQHAIATCCRRCIEAWHGIDRNQPLTEVEHRFITELIMIYIRKRMPELSEMGKYVPPIQNAETSG